MKKSFSQKINTFLDLYLPKKYITLFIITASIICGGLTYAAMDDWPQLSAKTETVFILLYIDLFFLLLFGTIIALHIIKTWTASKKGKAGSKLYIRIVTLFSLLAVTPTVIIATFSALFFNLGIQSWFNKRVNLALNESLAVAEAYRHEHQQAIKGDVLLMAQNINRNLPALKLQPEKLSKLLTSASKIHYFPEALIFNDQNIITAETGNSFSLKLEIPNISHDEKLKASNGEIILTENDASDRVRALIKLDSFFGENFLFVARAVDPTVIGHIDRTRGAVNEYTNLESRRDELQILFSIIFIVVSILLLFAAISVGLSFATKLTNPIGKLIEAAEKIKSGHLKTKVNIENRQDEIGILAETFNRMTEQLFTQQEKLLITNKKLDEKRRFSEAVLTGVSTGVIGLDAKGNIDLPNDRASELLNIDLKKKIGLPLDDLIPEMKSLLRLARQKGHCELETQFSLDKEEALHNVYVRIKTEKVNRQVTGYVLTFDDISELINAQKKAAWSDVARRIAHEIKNPLTPIQLSAERLKRKYLKQIPEKEEETFKICTDTIIRQVDDIRKMVDAFSNFARMPSPVIENHNIIEICKEVLFLQKNAFPEIEFDFQSPEKSYELKCDRRLISQALINIIQNAAQSITSRISQEGKSKNFKGKVILALTFEKEYCKLIILDNGVGLPTKADEKQKLLDAYYTTKEMGTGLGLAIVKKIIEDHHGTITLKDNEYELGACIEITLLTQN